MSSLREGMLGLWGVGFKKKRSRKWGRSEGIGGGVGSFTSTRLEPRWLARIQPHSVFDEGWILKLNQSHMSPTERARGRQTGPERDGDRQRDGGGGRYKGAEGGMGDRKGEKRQETVDGTEHKERRRRSDGQWGGNKGSRRQYTANWTLTKSHRGLVWDLFPLKNKLLSRVRLFS